MHKLLRCISILIFYQTALYSQELPGDVSAITPLEGAALHYRIVGFTFPNSTNAASYGIELARGNQLTDATFNSNKIQTLKGENTKIIAEVPSFGASYTWRYLYYSNKGTRKSQLHHFSTLPAPVADTNQLRIRVRKSDNAFKESHIFIDCTKAMFDMNGNAVWFLPENKIVLGGNGIVQDLKCTPRGTITFLNDAKFIEISYDGKILNQIQKTETNGLPANVGLHHQGSRLKNGHYLVLGNEVVTETAPADPLADPEKPGPPRIIPERCLNVVFGTLNEYDEKGMLVWQYRLSDYMANAILSNKIPEKGTISFDIHLNAFWLDEEQQMLYLGFKKISRIFKIRYPSGELLEILGGPYTPGQENATHSLFCHQHAMVTRGKNLFVFDNNDLDGTPVPKIEMFATQGWTDNTLKAEWSFQFPLTTKPTTSTSGGNLVILADGSLFASLSLPYSSLFIVNMKKEILWESVIEKKNTDGKTWVEMPTYRANIIEKKSDLQNLIWYDQQHQ